MISIQYAAGFFDGEGSITINLYHPKEGPPRPHIRVAVSNYIEAPVRMMQRRWGGSIHQGKRDAVWSLNLNGADARGFLYDVSPHLIVKKRAALAALMLDDVATPQAKLQCALDVMDATREGYRAKRSDHTYNEIKEALSILRERS